METTNTQVTTHAAGGSSCYSTGQGTRGWLGGRGGLVIALGNFEGTFYRYAKRYEEMKAWSFPPSAPLRRPSVSPATSADAAAAAAERVRATSPKAR